MKKAILYIFLVLLFIGCIGAVCKGFYEITSYYKWTDEALNTKLIRIDKSFTLQKSVTTVTANGKLMNCTKTPLVVNEGELIIYCQDISTDELLSFKNSTTYTFVPEKATTIYINIYKGTNTTESSKYASNIIENYRLIKIEYQVSENEIYTINTIAQTGSYLVPLGIYFAVPIILSVLIVSLIIFIQHQNDKTLKLNKLIKQLSTINKILILLILLLIPITFLSVGTFAFIDKHWSIATFCSLTVIFSLIFMGLVVFTIIVGMKSKRKTKIAKYIIKEKINDNTKIEPLTFIAEQKIKIKNIENEISVINNEIINYNNNKLLSEIRNVDSLNGWQFETYCAKLFTALGYQVKVTKGSGDFGADLILNNSISVQCKLYSGSVGLHALQEVYSSMARYKTNYAWVITNSTFTRQAKEYAYDAQIKLIDRIILKQLMIKAFNTHSEVYLKERQTKIIDLQNKIHHLNIEIEEIEKLNYLSYKEIKTLYKKYF